MMADSTTDTRVAEVDNSHSEPNGKESGTEATLGANEASTSSDNRPDVPLSADAEIVDPTEPPSNKNGATENVEDDEADHSGDEDEDEDEDMDENEEEPETRGVRIRDDRLRGRGGNRGGNGRSGYTKSNRENIRSRFDNLEESSDQDEIRRQVEFYFSDSNLPIDPYLFKLVGGHANNFIPLKTISDFKRMRHFQPYSTVLEAVKQSNFLEVNDKEELRRKEPLDKKFSDNTELNKKIQHGASMDNSIYAKGFGHESEKTQLEIEEFFQPFNAKVVRLRRAADNLFKGSVFVEFHDANAQKEFLDHEPKPLWAGKELQIMSKKAYVEMKHGGIVDGLVKPRSPTRHNTRGRGRGHDSTNYRRRDNNEDAGDREDWNKRRERDNGRDNHRGGGRRGRGGKRGRGGRGGRDNRRGRNNNSRDYDAEKADRAEAGAEQVEGIAKRLNESSNIESGTKRARDDADGDREGDSKKAKTESATVEG